MKKKVLITGGGRGIGAACVRKFSKEDFDVFFLYEKNREIAKSLAEETGAFAFQCDLGKEEEISKCVDLLKTIISEDGFDVIVCNAGISHIGLFQLMTKEEWARLMNVNLNGNVQIVRELVPAMISKKSGSIITVASMHGEAGASCEVAYSASKGGLIAFTRALAKELAPSNIRVNCVSPGIIDTDMNKVFDEETIAELAEQVPMGRLGAAEEVAEGIFFLSGDNASYITGQVLGINGGIL